MVIYDNNKQKQKKYIIVSINNFKKEFENI